MRMPEIETERLYLREITLQDAEDIYEYMRLKEVTDFMFTACASLQECQRYLKVEFLSYERMGLPSPYAIELKASGKVIGTCSFHTIEEDTAQVGFVLNPFHQHQGYMSEAMEMLLEMGFEILDLRRITAMHMNGNTACQHLLERLGFVKEGILREAVTRGDEALDMHLYSLLKREWRERNERTGK